MSEETTVVEEQEAPKELSNEDKIRAATNSPALAKNEFKLGDKTYKIIDLEYDEYLLFVSLLSPLLDAFISKVTKTNKTINVPGVNVPVENINTQTILKYCAQNLPEMVCIICKATDPDITAEQVKKRGKSPFKLATIVMMQVIQNNIIQDFADFFVQIAPLIRAL